MDNLSAIIVPIVHHSHHHGNITWGGFGIMLFVIALICQYSVVAIKFYGGDYDRIRDIVFDMVPFIWARHLIFWTKDELSDMKW